MADPDPAASGAVPFARVLWIVQHPYREVVFQSPIVTGSSINCRRDSRELTPTLLSLRAHPSTQVSLSTALGFELRAILWHKKVIGLLQ